MLTKRYIMLALYFCRLSCDLRVVAQLRSRTLGNSANRLYNTLREQHSDAWMRRAIQYLGVCEPRPCSSRCRSASPSSKRVVLGAGGTRTLIWRTCSSSSSAPAAQPPLPGPQRVPRTTAYRKRKAAEAAEGGGMLPWTKARQRTTRYTCSKCGQLKRIDTGRRCRAVGGKTVEGDEEESLRGPGGGTTFYSFTMFIYFPMFTSFVYVPVFTSYCVCCSAAE